MIGLRNTISVEKRIMLPMHIKTSPKAQKSAECLGIVRHKGIQQLFQPFLIVCNQTFCRLNREHFRSAELRDSAQLQMTRETTAEFVDRVFLLHSLPDLSFRIRQSLSAQLPVANPQV